MSHVSLVVLRSPGISWPSERVAAYRAGLEELGYAVEVLAVADPSSELTTWTDEPWCESHTAGLPGLAESAITGLRAARSRLVVLVDLALPYSPEDLFAVVEQLAGGEADLVIGARPNRRTGWLSRRILGTSDPISGLVAVTREAAIQADDSFSPVGSRFALELLARVAGRRVDVPVPPVRPVSRTSTPFGDLRQFKRLADDRFGNASRLIQFCFVGASGMVVDLTFYALFQAILSRTSLATINAPIVGGSLALATSAVFAIAIALTWNFSINRRLTFNDARQGSILRQYLRYVLSNFLGVAVSLSLRLILPNSFRFFSEHRLAAAVVGIVAATGISFSMARWFVFGHRPALTETEDRKAPIVKRRCEGFRSQVLPRARRLATLELEPSSERGN